MTTNTIKQSFLALQDARDTVHDETQEIKRSIKKETINRFFEYLRANPTHGYVDMNFEDFYDDTPDAFNPLVIPQRLTSKDFKLRLKDSDSNGLYYHRKSERPYRIGQHFVIPLEYFENPQRWENQLEMLIDNDHVNAFNALLKVFPDLAESKANNEINVNMTQMDYLGKGIVLFKLDQTPLLGEQEYNKPFLYHGVTYGRSPVAFIYVKSLNTIYYKPSGFSFGDNLNFRAMELTKLPTKEEIDNFDWTNYDVNNPIAKLVYIR